MIDKEIETTVILVLGMAGSGKTSFVKAFQTYIKSIGKSAITINLDPAVQHIPYSADIDIRKEIDYKEIMKKYCLGPNGAILTSLNLYCTKITQFIEDISAQSVKKDYVIVDTPGQIEVFTWSASGSIYSETLARTFPTNIIYVIDSSKAIRPTTFISNMLYALSCMYRSRLPLMIAFNKSDMVDCSPLPNWIEDYETFQKALDKEDSSYSRSLANSLALVLESFYNVLKFTLTSSKNGSGFEQVCSILQQLVIEFKADFCFLLLSISLPPNKKAEKERR